MRRKRKVWFQFGESLVPAVETGRRFLWFREIIYRTRKYYNAEVHCRREWVTRDELYNRP